MRRVLHLLFAASLVGWAGCDSEAAQRAGAEEVAEVAPSPVETLVVGSTEYVDTFEVLGTGEPLEAVDVASDVPGQVLEAYVDDGDPVARGEVLFRIDVETEEAGREVLETQVEAAQRELERLKRLREEGLTTQQQVDNARTELAQARKNLRQSEVSIGRNTVRSPIEGHVAARLADAGEFANAGMPLAELIDYSTIVVYARVPESQIRYVDAGDDTELEVEFPALESAASGVIARVALRPSSGSRTYTVELHVNNEELRIRPGMRARVHFERHRHEDAVVIPRDSILEGYDGREIMVVPGKKDIARAETRRIETGPGSRDEIVVTDGLAAGERLILRGHRGLIGDARVEVVEQHHQFGEGDDS